jgi:hypothetical protein
MLPEEKGFRYDRSLEGKMEERRIDTQLALLAGTTRVPRTL